MIKSNKNELAIIHTEPDISTVQSNGLYPEIIRSANYSLNIYSDIIKSDSVPDEIKNKFADICTEREKTFSEIAVLFVCGIILTSVICAVKRR